VLARALSCSLQSSVTTKGNSMELEGNDALDLDELKGHDDKAFRCTRTATGDNGKLARHFRLAGQRLERLAPEIIRGTETRAITLEDGAEMAGKERTISSHV
jgi:hypothetical protein